MSGSLAAVYARISDDKVGAGLGIERQREDCIPICHRRGYADSAVRVYVDNDLSAYSGKLRPAYERLLRDVESGEIGLITAWHPDRLHRRPVELEHFIDVIQKHRVEVETARAGTIDLSTATGRMIARIIGVQARFESEHKSDRLHRKHLELAAAGKNAGGGRPFGFEPDRLTIRDSEAELIREAAKRVLAGESLRAVCRDFNARHISTAGKSEGWSPTVLRMILVSARISGRRERQVRPDGKRGYIGTITNPIAAWSNIINTQESDRLREMFRNPAHRGPKFSYLLTGGLARCGLCGSALIARPMRGKRTLTCVREVDKHGCGKIRIQADPLEAIISEAVLQRVDGGALAAVMREQDDPTTISELLEVESELVHLASDFGSGHLKRPEWEAARASFAAREERLRRQLETHHRTHGLDNLPDPLRVAWPSLAAHQRRAVIGALVEAIIINSGTRARFDPGRIQIRWKA